MAIGLDLRSLRRFWSLEAGHLEFVLEAGFDDEQPLLEELLETARGVRARLAGGQNPCDAEGWVRTKAGWAGVLVAAFTLEDGVEWLELFVATWGRAVDGMVVGGPRSRPPRGRDPEPQLTVFAAYTTGDLTTVGPDDRMALWSVDRTTTAHLAEQSVHWAWSPGCHQHLRRATDWVDPLGLDHGLALAQACARYGAAEVLCTQDGPFRSRLAAFQTHGRAIYQVTDGTVGWRERLDLLREVLTWSPPRTDLCMVRHGLGGSTGWATATVAWPAVPAVAVDYNQPLLASFVPDVSGIQLLTDAHMERGEDLSGWRVEPLGGGRHLVEAHDLEPWFARPQPDPEVLAQARSDFGAMVLTPELVDRHQPWPAGDPWHRSWAGRR